MPSKHEREYFAKQEADLIAKKREREREAAIKAERESHFMKCCKCGADLVEEDYRGVLIDRCPECHGLWFDAGEVDKMVEGQEEGGFVGGILKSVFSLRQGPSSKDPD